MAQSKEVRGRATSVRTEDGRTMVRYHSTDVVEFDAESVTLRTGGYRTNTTKLRMNQASAQYGLGFMVYQKGGEWFVSFPGDPNGTPAEFAGETFTFKR